LSTSRGSDASAQSAPRRKADAGHYLQQFCSALRRGSERLLASAFAFPLLLGLFALDYFLPSAEGVFLLAGMLAISGLCAEEYVTFLRGKELRAPAGLGFYGALIAPLIGFCWRPASQPETSLGMLTIITLALVFCTLMVALALIAEVSEKMLTGLAVFVLASGVSLLIGLVFAHLLFLRETGAGGWLAPAAALVVGWAASFGGRLLGTQHSDLPLISKFAGLGTAAIALFWAMRVI